MRRNWEPGQHIAIWGKTRSGKTFVACQLTHLRKYAAVLVSKQEDDTFERYADFTVVKSWNDRKWNDWHVMVWPYGRTLVETDASMRRESALMLDAIWYEKNWTIQLDDAKKLKALGQTGRVKLLFSHAGSQHTSIIFNDQRPFETVQEALDQTSYNLMFFQKDKRDVWRLAEANGENPLVFAALNSQLQEYEFLFIPTHGEIAIVRRD